MSLPGVSSRESKGSALVHAGGFWVAYLLILVLTGRGKYLVPEPYQPLVWGLSSSGLILATSFAFLRRDGRTWRDAGLNLERGSAPRLLGGLAVGFAVYGANILVVGALTGGLRFERVGWPTLGTLLPTLGGTLALAGMEELGFRAYSLRKLLAGFPAWQAQGMVAVAFGLCHLAFGWSWAAVCLGVVPSALLFGTAAVASRGLAVPIGIHAGLNIVRWAVENGGIWRTAARPGTEGKILAVASVSGVLITLVTAFPFWWWGARRSASRPSDPGIDGSSPRPGSRPSSDAE